MGPFLSDLLKVFDCIDHKLLKHGTKQTKINDYFSAWSNIEYGVPQGSILDPLLFWLTYFTDPKKLILQTMLSIKLPIHVLHSFPLSFLNYRCLSQQQFLVDLAIIIKANPGKCYLLLITRSPEVVSMDEIRITSSTAETILGITINLELNFENYLSVICNKVSRNIIALGLIVNYMFPEKRQIMMKTFNETQFNYCPPIWMICS